MRSQRTHPCIDFVSLDDRTHLLTMDTFNYIQPLSWVRIKRYGRYKGDLGFAHSVDSETSMVDVYVVPRIQMDRKRKRKHQAGEDRRRRPPAALFDDLAVSDRYGAEQVVRYNQVFEFRGGVYLRGLLDHTFSPTDLSDVNVNPTPHELQLFRGSQQKVVLDALNAAVSLHTGDRIKVITGTFIGLSGRVVDLKDDNTVVFETNDAKRHETYTSEIRKYFSRGDYVRVLEGDLHGKEGFIIELGSNSAVIFGCTTGEEVRSETH